MDKQGKNKEAERVYPLRHIYFYLTEGCNLACRHCWIGPKYQQENQKASYLSLSLFKSIIEQAKLLGLTNVKLTGGEPLLHPGILEIMDFLRQEGLILDVETNVVLCTPEIARAIASGNRPFVSVSLDGVDAKTHEWVRGVPGCFEGALEGLHNLVDAGLKPQIVMTLMQRNKDQIESMISLAESLGAGSLKFNILQPSARGEIMHRNDEALAVRDLISLGNRVQRDFSKNTGIKIFFDHPPAFNPMSSIFGDGGNGCGTCRIINIIGVLFDGSYALCGIGQNIPEFIFGNAAVDRLEDVWKGAKALREIREGLPSRLKGICGECAMRNICLGRCIAQNYNSSKDLWAPFWYCEEALREGIFPESRHMVLRRDANLDSRTASHCQILPDARTPQP